MRILKKKIAIAKEKRVCTKVHAGYWFLHTGKGFDAFFPKVPRWQGESPQRSPKESFYAQMQDYKSADVVPGYFAKGGF